MTTAAQPIVRIEPLGFPWETIDPFLFCVHHDDAYPKGNARLGPDAPLAGRDLGQDFSRKDGWSMYHGREVPGFPGHPHRGFETVTIVRKGLIDHSDSLGATARFGGGDVQWLTAGKGIVHAEMFPLLDRFGAESARAVPDLAQPAGEKQDGGAALHDALVGGDSAPVAAATKPAGRPRSPASPGGSVPPASTPLPPPPDSWAAEPDADLAIWTIRMAPGARWTLPAARRRRDPADALLLQGRLGARRRPRAEEPRRDRAARRRRGRAGERRRGGRRVPAAPGPADRRAGGAAGAVRHEHAGRDRRRPSPTTGARSSAAGRGRTTRRCTAATRRASPATATAARNARCRRHAAETASEAG